MSIVGGILAIVAASLGIVLGLVSLSMGWLKSALGKSASTVRPILEPVVDNEIVRSESAEATAEIQPEPQALEELTVEEEEELEKAIVTGGTAMTRHGIISTICSIAVLVLGIVAITTTPHWALGVTLMLVAVVGIFIAGFGIAFCLIGAVIVGILTLVPDPVPAEEL